MVSRIDNDVYLGFVDNGYGNRAVGVRGYNNYNILIPSSGSYFVTGDTWNWPSDDRLKHNEENISNSLNIVRQLAPQTYDMTNEFHDADYTGTISGDFFHRAGFIAQEIRAINDISYCCVGKEYDASNNPTSLAVDYNSIFTHGIAAIQDLDITVEAQKLEIISLNQENNTLKSELNIMKNALNTLLTNSGLANI